MGDHNAAKAGMLAFSKTLSQAHAITVNGVCPALLDTPLREKLASQLIPGVGQSVPDVYETLASQYLVMGRYARPEEVSGLVASSPPSGRASSLAPPTTSTVASQR